MNFVRAVLDGEPLICPGAEALPVVRTTEALYRSAAENRPVRLDE